MTLSTPPTRFRRRATGLFTAAVVVVGAGLVGAVVAGPVAHAAEARVALGTAAAYSVLGGEAVRNTGPSTLDANLGVSPGSVLDGFPPGLVGGASHAADAASLQAQSDLVIGYDDAAGRASDQAVAGDLVGLTLSPGTYTAASALEVTGTLTLDGGDDSDALFVFQIGSALTTGSASRINLINGAQACNVFWQVGSSATLGTGSSFVGTVMALTSIVATTGTTIDGRLLARNAQVTLDTNTFTTSECAAEVDEPGTSTGETGPGTGEPTGTESVDTATGPGTTAEITTSTTTTSTPGTPESGGTTTSPGITTTASAPIITNPPSTYPTTSAPPTPFTPRGPDSSPPLASTGSSATSTVALVLGLVLLTAGGLLLMVSRTRRPRTDSR